jgi:hypothetical protein
MNLSEKTLDRLAEALLAKFHRVKWEDTEEGSEVNRENWRQCVTAVLSEYENWLKEPPKGRLEMLEIYDDPCKYPDYQVGDKFRVLETIYFMCGKQHKKGEIYEATKESLGYFRVYHKDYEKIKENI